MDQLRLQAWSVQQAGHGKDGGLSADRGSGWAAWEQESETVSRTWKLGRASCCPAPGRDCESDGKRGRAAQTSSSAPEEEGAHANPRAPRAGQLGPHVAEGGEGRAPSPVHLESSGMALIAVNHSWGVE